MIKNTIKEFLEQYARLSAERCEDIYCSAAMAIFYLMKVKNRDIVAIDAGIAATNLLLLIGWIAEILSYGFNREHALFDMLNGGETTRPICF